MNLYYRRKFLKSARMMWRDCVGKLQSVQRHPAAARWRTLQNPLHVGRSGLRASQAGFAVTVFVLTNLVVGVEAQAVGNQSANHRMAFEVASIRPDKSTGRPISDFPIGPGRIYVPRGGIFRATHIALIQYIGFAYNLTQSEMAYLAGHGPDWGTTEGFDITARVEGTPSEDQLRLMMQSLLEDRFKLAIHKQDREVPVLALVLANREPQGHISCRIRLINLAQRRRRPLRHGKPFQGASQLLAMELLYFRLVLRVGFGWVHEM
jgi:hypothetical protein